MYKEHKVPEVFLSHDNNLCFCDECMTSRGDNAVYSRGQPPKSYALPRGWFRFGLKLPPKATALSVFEKWHVAYHGTRSDCVVPILNTGELLMTGDKGADTAIRPPEGHYDENWKPEGFNINKVYLSPSMNYSGCDVYAPRKPYQNPHKAEQKLFARVGFQVRIQPGKYDVGRETIGATEKKQTIDKNFKNSELEWSTDKRGVLVLTALLVKIES